MPNTHIQKHLKLVQLSVLLFTAGGVISTSPTIGMANHNLETLLDLIRNAMDVNYNQYILYHMICYIILFIPYRYSYLYSSIKRSKRKKEDF